jgi:flagellar hook-basal body complex protein FliE
MSINFNPQLTSVASSTQANKPKSATSTENNADFAKAVIKSLNSVNDQQSKADASIVDLLSGKNQDVNSVVASVAKADMSFKLLVGVRNKLVEAYKETMKMQV